MAKKSVIKRGEKKAKLIFRYSNRRKNITLALKKSISYQEKLLCITKLQSLPPNSAASRHRNRCWVTGRSRAFYRNFGLSRHALRELAHEGNIPGLSKASW